MVTATTKTILMAYPSFFQIIFPKAPPTLSFQNIYFVFDLKEKKNLHPVEKQKLQ